MLFAGAGNCAAQRAAENAVAAIWNAYESLEFEVAEARIAEALSGYEAFTPAQLSEVHTVFALLLYAQSDLDGAQDQLRQALQLNPATTLDPVETPPELLDLFDRIKEAYVAEQPDMSDVEVRYLLIHDPRASAAIRSMVVPGWGQLHKQERKKAIWMAGLWGVTAGGSLLAHVQRRQAKNHYDGASTSAEALARFDAFSTWHKIRNSLALGAAGVWIYSYLDAIITGAPRVNQVEGGNGLRFSVRPAPGHTRVRLSWHF